MEKKQFIFYTFTNVEHEQGKINIANNIKQFRKDLGYSQKKLAEETNISVHSICAYETGRRMPSQEHMEKICSVLKIPIKEVHRYYEDIKQKIEAKENDRVIEGLRMNLEYYIENIQHEKNLRTLLYIAKHLYKIEDILLKKDIKKI